MNSSIDKKPSPKSILLIGPPGGGKTTLAMQFPNVWFADCDENLDGPHRFVRSKRSDLAFHYDNIRYDDTGKPLPIHMCFDALMSKLDAIAKEPSIKTVVIDSLTHVNEFIIRKVLFEQGNKSIMEPHFWAPFKSYTYRLLVARLRSLGKTTICCCHEVILTKADDKKIGVETVVGYKPAYQGGVTDYFGGFFTDMWRCYCQGGVGGKSEFVLVPGRTETSDFLKNSIGLDGSITIKSGELLYDKIRPALEANS